MIEKPQASRRDPVSAVVVFVFAAAVFHMAGGYAAEAAMFPRAVAVIMMLSAAGLFVKGLYAPTSSVPIEPDERRRLIVAVLLTVAYVIAIVPLGFITASLILLPAMTVASGMRNYAVIGLTAIIFVPGVYFLFERLFHAPLPPELIMRLF